MWSIRACLAIPYQQRTNDAAPGTPIILVGTKRDLREDPIQLEKLRDRRQEPISFNQGNEKAKEIKAAKVSLSLDVSQHVIMHHHHRGSIRKLAGRKPDTSLSRPGDGTSCWQAKVSVDRRLSVCSQSTSQALAAPSQVFR